MNIPILSEKDYVSVLPRIIDPKMQFTKESIENTFDNKKAIVDNNKYKTSNETVFNEKTTSKNNLSMESEPSSFLSDYKYVIIIVIIVITLVIIYFIYRYYTKEKPTDPKIADTEEKPEIDENKSKEKTETVNTYLSSYIQDDDNEEEEGEEDKDEKNNESKEQETEDILEFDNYNNKNMSMLQSDKQPAMFGATIIVSEFDICSTMPKNNISTSTVEEIIENMSDCNNEESYKYDSLKDDIPIMENKDEMDNMISYKSKDDERRIDDIISSIKENEDSEEEDYKSLLDIEDNETNENNEITKQKKELESNKKVKQVKKKESGSTISKPKKLNSSDDITYFQKFNKST